MNFVTFNFLIFFLVTLTLWSIFSAHWRWRLALMLGANLFFYSAAGLQYLPLLLLVVVFNWLMGLAVQHGKMLTRFWLAAGVAGNVLILGFFKYYEFFILQAQSFLAQFDLVLPVQVLLPQAFFELALPIGLSFYIFQAIAYLVEIAHHRQRAENFFQVLFYLSFFPTILAGPIMRPWQFFPQAKSLLTGAGSLTWPGQATQGDYDQPLLKNTNVFNFTIQIPQAFALIVSGLFKKVVLASFLAEHVVRDVFQGPEAYSSLAVLMAVYGYSIQIFCDFSGYTDLAMGLALLLGFTLPQNFKAPYLACNLQDFWRRWHISLSTWLRDYVYIPLGGNQRGNRYLNLALTMVLGGLWHGAHGRFIVWGAIHALGLMAVHGVRQLVPSRPKNNNSGWALLTTCCSWLLTFNFVSLAWIFFRAENMTKAWEILQRLCFWGQPGQGFLLLALPAIGCGLLLQIVGPQLFSWFVTLQTRLPLVLQAITIALMTSMILRMGPDGVLPFIYFQF